MSCIDEVPKAALMKVLYKLLVERNVFICQNFNEVIISNDLDFFSQSVKSLEVCSGLFAITV